MSAANKVRGNQLEYEVVDLAKAAGLMAIRAWGSNGKSIGHTENVDCVVTYWKEKAFEHKDLRIQCKRKKKLPEYLVLDKLGTDYDAVIFRQDGKPLTHYIMMDYKQFLELIK